MTQNKNIKNSFCLFKSESSDDNNSTQNSNNYCENRKENNFRSKDSIIAEELAFEEYKKFDEIDEGKFKCPKCNIEFLMKEKEDHLFAHSIQEELKRSNLSNSSSKFINHIRNHEQGNNENNNLNINPYIENESDNLEEKYNEERNSIANNNEQNNINIMNINDSMEIYNRRNGRRHLFDSELYNSRMSEIEGLEWSISDFGIKGLKESLLNQLPEMKVNDINKLDPEKRKCVICLNNFQQMDTITVLPCVHIFHTECIKTWLQSHPDCPLCKFIIKEGENI